MSALARTRTSIISRRRDSSTRLSRVSLDFWRQRGLGRMGQLKKTPQSHSGEKRLLKQVERVRGKDRKKR